jgi:hypothetical protein
MKTMKGKRDASEKFALHKLEGLEPASLTAALCNYGQYSMRFACLE